jgi:parallel beta-helix repeat protein
LSGNGYTAAGNNFGIGLIAPGTNDNVIIDNVVTGNTNGIRLVAGVQGNFIRRNIIAGNAPVQVNASDPNAGGVDILNLDVSCCRGHAAAHRPTLVVVTAEH